MRRNKEKAAGHNYTQLWISRKVLLSTKTCLTGQHSKLSRMAVMNADIKNGYYHANKDLAPSEIVLQLPAIVTIDKAGNQEVNNSSSDENIKFIKDILKTGYDVKDIEKYSIALGDEFRCIYSNLPNITHSCNPNTYHMVQSSKDVVFRASVAIKKGDLITFSKTDITKCNLFRRRQLKTQYITCECER